MPICIDTCTASTPWLVRRLPARKGDKWDCCGLTQKRGPFAVSTCTATCDHARIHRGWLNRLSSLCVLIKIPAQKVTDHVSSRAALRHIKKRNRKTAEAEDSPQH
eukprot:1145863-Pelagomonas_calceolata.AAC.1